MRTMDPRIALSLAGNIVQFIDFSAKIYSQMHELRTKYEKASNTLEDILYEQDQIRDTLCRLTHLDSLAAEKSG